MNIRKATLQDLETLIRLRLDFLETERGFLTEAEKNAIVSQLTAYYPAHLNRDCIAVVAEVAGQVASSAFLVITERPANPAFITGKTGTILNVFTYPAYRRKGLAEKVMISILDEARVLEVSSLELSATPDGRHLYEKLGFTEKKPKHMPMKLQLIE